MTSGNDSATGFAWSEGQSGEGGLTKREYFASHSNEPMPYAFVLSYIREKEKRVGGCRETDRSYGTMLTIEEKMEVKALWKVKCADALIKALNETI